MILLIRNMKSDRCKSIVMEELNTLRLHYKSVELGEVELYGTIPNEKLQLFANSLKKSDLELIVSNKINIINKIKEAILQLIHSSDQIERPNFSEYLVRKVNYDYNYLSKIFSEIEGITIEKYYIQLRIERVREMLVKGGTSLSEISYKMLYSSVAHLSNQFKKVTGITPFNFRNLMENQGNL